MVINLKDLRIYYQPIIDLRNGQIQCFEALMRWQHPTQGLLSPKHIISIAEEKELSVQIDHWVLNTACQQLAIWKSQFTHCFPLKLCMNLSMQYFYETNLVENIDQILVTTGLTGDSIVLELDEPTLLQDLKKTIDLVIQLRSRKIQISIDNLGLHCISLYYLKNLSADNFKIDRSVLWQIPEEQNSVKTIQAMVSLTQALDMDLIIVGIENFKQFSLLIELKCKLGQGYFISKPLSAPEIETLFIQKASSIDTFRIS